MCYGNMCEPDQHFVGVFRGGSGYPPVLTLKWVYLKIVIP